jgi:hypothetical protein
VGRAAAPFGWYCAAISEAGFAANLRVRTLHSQWQDLHLQGGHLFSSHLAGGVEDVFA